MPATMKRPFWLHQLAEYVIGFVAIASGFQSLNPLAPTLMGGLVLINAAIADGPFGAFRWVGRRRHRIADWVVLVLMIGLTAFVSSDLSARLVQAALIVIFAVVILGTQYAEPAERRARLANDSGTALYVGRRAGRTLGTLAGRIRDQAKRNEDSK